jgi:4-hydroxythreonine-4-phosphate dehydrogenase
VNPTSHRAPLVVTPGEPAGIGPDLCVQLAATPPEIPLIVVADKHLLLQRAAQLYIPLRILDYPESRQMDIQPNSLTVIHVPLAASCRAGILDAANSEYVLATLRRAAQGCMAGEFSGMVTAPVHKGIINDAGFGFSGHTEFLAELTGAKQVVMMLVGSGLRVALATTHIPLKDVPAAITAPLLENVLTILQHDLQQRFGIARPRILVTGLNPHAGEGGYLGREEIEVMIPLLDKLRAGGMKVSAPLPADTLFTPHKLAQCDCVLAMYHDQGLPVLKHASFGQGVNVTLGMPIIRTSVDHGTALDLAGTGNAGGGSLLEAIRLADQMSKNRTTVNEHA